MEKEVVLVQESRLWGQIEAAAQNAVVQIFAQVGKFNWQEPYKVEDQYENRGSGFFINNEGYFITNAHVIQEAKRIWIHIPALGREPLYAYVVSICPERDIALLCLTKESIDIVLNKIGMLPYLPLGNSDQIQRTESVLSLGYPLGQHHLKSTTGVISGRELLLGRALIQITAPINPGNSGGPLLNAFGQVIGIAIATIPLANNIGYAIPINELIIVLENMFSKKLVHKPILGAQFMSASDEKAIYLNNPLPAGLYVLRVFQGSILDKAGIRAGDMLYEFNGYRIDAYGDANADWAQDKISFYDLISRIKIDQEVPMVFYREGKPINITVPFIVKNIFAIRPMYPEYESVEYETIGGMIIMELAINHLPVLLESAPELIEYEFPQNRLQSVLVVAHILPGSYTHQLRMIRVGDIITHINNKRVRKLNDYRRMIRLNIGLGIITLTTKLGALVVFSLKKLLEDEARLCEDFGYPLSKTVQRLYRAVEKKNGGGELY